MKYKDNVIAVIAIVIMVMILSGEIIYALYIKSVSADRRPDVALLLAQSCAGEAGFGSALTGECAAILWVYRKRAARVKSTIYIVAQQYSAAIKPKIRHRQPWVIGLNRMATCPDRWQRGLPWRNHKKRWLKLLSLADDFVAGRVADPTPTALHYGGRMDTGLSTKQWEQMYTPRWHNLFYQPRRTK